MGTKKFDSPTEDGSSCLLLYMWASSTMFSFSVWSGKEVSLDCISKISQGTREVTKIVSALILSCTSISEFMHVLNNTFRVLKMLWYQLLDVKDRVMILCHIIRNDKQMLFTDYGFLLCTLNTIHFFIWVPVENGDMHGDWLCWCQNIQIEFHPGNGKHNAQNSREYRQHDQEEGFQGENLVALVTTWQERSSKENVRRAEWSTHKVRLMVLCICQQELFF